MKLDHKHVCQPAVQLSNPENFVSLKLFQINSIFTRSYPYLDQVLPDLLVTVQPVLLVTVFIIKQTTREARFNFSLL
jgi:hypothetical protein